MRPALKETAAVYTKPLLFALAIQAVAVALWVAAWHRILGTRWPEGAGQMKAGGLLILRGELALLTMAIVALAARRHARVGAIAVVVDAAFFALILADEIEVALRRAGIAIPWELTTLVVPTLCSICGLVLFFLLFSLVCLRLLQALLELRARPLRRHLAQRGYDWLTMEQARRLVAIAGNEAYLLPPWEDAGQLPGVNDQDMESLGRLAARARSKGQQGRSGP